MVHFIWHQYCLLQSFHSCMDFIFKPFQRPTSLKFSWSWHWPIFCTKTSNGQMNWYWSGFHQGCHHLYLYFNLGSLSHNPKFNVKTLSCLRNVCHALITFLRFGHFKKLSKKICFKLVHVQCHKAFNFAIGQPLFQHGMLSFSVDTDLSGACYLDTKGFN